MPKLFLIFSHKLTEQQVKDAEEALGITEFVYLPDHLQVQWSNINPYGDLPEELFDTLKQWLIENAASGDYTLIQGDFGATYIAVNMAFDLGLIPVYATTERISKEIANQNGEIERKQIFKHVCYREYKKLEDMVDG
ncbi:MAG: CRISPR-associated protein Csx20 [Cyanobacteriota bacterium]